MIEGTENVAQPEEPLDEGESLRDVPTGQASLQNDDEGQPRKFYIDGGHVEIAAHIVHELDADDKQLRVVAYADYTAEKVRMLYPSVAILRQRWADPESRASIIAMLEDRGISFDELAESTEQPDADPFDLLCHLAFNAPLPTRRERAERLRREKQDFFDRNLVHKLVADCQSLFDLLRSSHHQINWQYPDTRNHTLQNFPCLPEWAALVWHYDQQINVRLRRRLAISL